MKKLLQSLLVISFANIAMAAPTLAPSTKSTKVGASEGFDYGKAANITIVNNTDSYVWYNQTWYHATDLVVPAHKSASFLLAANSYWFGVGVVNTNNNAQISVDAEGSVAVGVAGPSSTTNMTVTCGSKSVTLKKFEEYTKCNLGEAVTITVNK